MKLTTIIVFLIPVVVARHNHRTLLETILKSKGNLYTKVDDDVQNVMNNLFDELNLAPIFLAKSRIKLLLTMHYDLKSIAEKNFDVFEKMTEAAKSNTGNKTTNGIELFELIEEILDDKSFNLSVTSYKNKVSRKHTKSKTKTTTPATTLKNVKQSDSVFADSKEFMKFINDFIKKVDNLNEKDFTKTTPLLPSDEEDNTESNFEVWQPPSILELDYVNDTNSRRIFKGKRSKIKSYPFIVSVHIMGTFACAGSIIKKDLIITAASCLQLLYNNRFYRENPRAVFIRVGSDYFARGGERILIMESYFHPSYDPKTLNNNLVLLRTYKQIRFLRKEKRVKRIRYDRTLAHLAANTEGIIVAGWGSRKGNNIISQFERLLVAQLDIYHIEECKNVYSKQYVTDKHFCAGFISSGGGACNKDVGGPGIVGGILVGVISFGAPICGAVDSPTVFTKLGHYAKWIDSIANQTSQSIQVRTTLRPVKSRIPIFNLNMTKATVSPITPNVELSKVESTADEDVLAVQAVFNELLQANSSILREILYGDYAGETEDIFQDMFTTTEMMDPMEHPLVNKSYFAIPGIHIKETETSKYVTVPLTTSSTVLPIPPQLTDPTGTTTPPPSRTPPIIPETHITDIVYDFETHDFETHDFETHDVETHEYETITPLPVPRADYDLYEEITTAAPTTQYNQRHHHDYRDYDYSSDSNTPQSISDRDLISDNYLESD